ncbi:hypothetical protein SLEP1_g30922 [Rubroshorea leprosula]|uniref:RRM domain-containing protein n=1 Tax=Rubroshorea leprosula TaxID=152421 RepID=A0AAV5K9M1_9ROSI|nr:hypothetical protein SLEP1_g30922 [Rubroshorea leprosula]
MDFDEYEYLEKMVENPEPEKMKENTSGGDGGMKTEEKEHSRSAKDRSHKKKGNNYNDSHRFKRQKSVDESHDHNQGKERGSSSHHSRSRDGERDRQRSDREQKNRNRDLERSRDKEERNGKHKARDQDRNGRDHGHDLERDKEREREQSRRSRSQSERNQSDQDEKDRERSQENEFREKEREREFREHNRESRRQKEKKEEVSVLDADPERDQRTVFAYQLSIKASERDVYEFFSKAGKVRDVRLIMDRISRRSKGVGYIEFYDAMSVPMAIALCGQPLLGQPVMVKPSEAEKNLVQSTASAAGGSGGQFGPYSGGARRLYVGNLHHNITEDQLRLVFEAFGTVELVQLPLDETGHCKGYGFVQFARLEDARNALTMNGEVQIAGRPIEVSTVTNQVGMHDDGANAGDLDDEEGGGLPLNSHSRALLMQKLDRSGTASSIPGLAGAPVMSSSVPTAAILSATPGVSQLVPPSLQALSGLMAAGFQLPAINVPTINTIGDPSECLLLKNMFDPKLEMEPDFDLDIGEDVREECSRFGNLKHIHVDKESDGFVYLRFENTQAAVSAQRNLHGRWFAGKMITATFMVPQTYKSKFPDCST